jgi:DNA-binding SARP family transcriptional activator/TolB-like protein
MIRLQLFGPAHVSRADGADASALLAQPKRLALLAYLAVSANVFHRRDSLLAVFWPELDQFAARRALRNTLYQLRLALGDDLFATRGDEEVMIDGGKVWCDVVALREAVAAGRFDEGVELYRGELLDGFHVSNVGETFQEWLERERARARDAALRSLGAVVDRAEHEGRREDAAKWAVRGSELAPLDEAWMRRAALALDASGDRSGAIRVYETFARRLAADLEVEPSADARKFFERLRTATPMVAVTPTRAPVAAPVAAPVTAPVAVDSPAPPLPLQHKRRRWWPFVGAGAIAVLAAIAWFARSSPAAASKGRVIVTVFDNRTGDPRLDPVGDMVVDWLTRSIVQTHLVDVVDPRVLFTRGRTPDGRPVEPIALARRNGASTLVSGSYYRSGDSILFIASIIDVPSANVIRSVGPLAANLTRPVDGVEATRSRVLASLVSILDPHFGAYWNAKVSPPPFEAYSPFIAGWDEFWFGDAARAESLFAQAAARDTTFDAAAIALATAATRLSDCATVDSVTNAPRLKRHHLDAIDGLNLRIAGAHCHGRSELLLGLVIDRSRLIAPSSPLQVSTAGAALWADRPGIAIEALHRMNPATDLDWLPTPDHVDYWQDLCEAYHLLGQHDSEEVAAERQSPTHTTLDEIFNRTRALAGLHRSSEVLRSLDSSIALPPEPRLGFGLGPYTNGSIERTGTPAWAALFAARELSVHGDTSAAHEAAATGLAWIASRSPAERQTIEFRTYEVWLRELQGRYADALPIAQRLVAGDTSNVDFRGTLGGLAAAMGDSATARRTDAWLAGLSEDRGSWASSFYRARIAVLRGRPDEGVALVRETLERGAWPYFLHADPVLHQLAGRADYKALTVPRR